MNALQTQPLQQADFAITRRNGKRIEYRGPALGVIAVMVIETRHNTVTITETRRKELTARGLKIAEPVPASISGAPADI